MTAIWMLTGLIIGVVGCVLTILLYNRVMDEREKQERIERQQRRIRFDLKHEQRDRQEQNIIEQARVGLQRREEG